MESVASGPGTSEKYATWSSRITGGVVMALGALCLVDIVVEWRTRGGLITAFIIAIVMLLAYIALVRPSITLHSGGLRIRNHVRDHDVPWSQVEGADVTDLVRVETAERRFRCPGVQLAMRDLRRQRAGRVKPQVETSISRAGFVVDRIHDHAERYGETSTGAVRTRWAVPELAVLGALAVLVLIAWLAG